MTFFVYFWVFVFVFGSFWNKWRKWVNELLEQWQWVSRLFDDVSFFDFRSLIWRVFRPRSLALLLNQYVPFVLSHLSILSSQQPDIIIMTFSATTSFLTLKILILNSDLQGFFDGKYNSFYFFKWWSRLALEPQISSKRTL